MPWHDVDFEAVQQEETPKGLLALSYEDFSVQENPSYYRHFSLSKIEEGRPVLLELSESITRKAFAEGLRMDEGNYLLVSGTRLADGSVLAHLEFFQLQGDSKETVPLRMRSSEEQLQVIGGFDSESLYTTLQGEHKSLLSTTGRGYYVVQIEAGVIVLDPVAFDLERCVGLGIESTFACDKSRRFQLLQLPCQVSVAFVAKSFCNLRGG